MSNEQQRHDISDKVWELLKPHLPGQRGQWGGIAEDNQARIWDRFYQVDPSRSASSSGAGLGLAMVKGMADALSGSVSVESAPGQGSVFTFTFPKNPRKDTE